MSQLKTTYSILSKYSERQAWANGVDLDQMSQNVLPGQGLQCLLLIQQFVNASAGNKMDLFKV